MSTQRRDFDSFDPYCDHLIIIDRAKGEGAAGIIATYRLMRREQASRRGQFYSIDEYDISSLVNYRGGILELGRSCVDPAYRTKAAMNLMWKGIADYILHYNIGVLFGCASFPGTDPEEHKTALSYLYHRHLAPPEYRARALPGRYVSMNMMPIEEIAAAADQGLSAPRRFRRRRRGGRSAIRHSRRQRRGGARPHHR
jgi:putative hemolysin